MVIVRVISDIDIRNYGIHIFPQRNRPIFAILRVSKARRRHRVYHAVGEIHAAESADAVSVQKILTRISEFGT